MPEPDPNRIRELFAQLFDLDDAERERRLAELAAAEGDRELVARVRSLLAHGDNPSPVLLSPDEPIGLPAAVRLPGRIADYEVLSEIGAGGMGIVYRAQQASPQRTVAVKVVRAGLLSEAYERRFAHEVEVMGLLDHPGVAQIFEAGTCELGFGRQPYFAMEFIDGVSLRDYVEAEQAGPREILALVAKIADAVAHAHQKGVVHRDLKPSNILVTEAGQPKVLDFGIAGTVDSSEHTRQTIAGQIVGTITYMSPEQASGDREHVDTRWDVYALGVIAYELLTGGGHPHVTGTESVAETLRLISANEPQPIWKLVPALRGDIATVVHQALARDPDRRYPTAESLAADIRRLLRHQPISARPATAAYQLKMFARRHRTLVVASLLVLGSLVFTVFWSMASAREANAAAVREAAANGSLKDALADLQAAMGRETAANEKTRIALDKAEAVNDFLTANIIRLATPSVRGNKPPTLLAALEHLGSHVGRAFADSPLIEASLRQVLSQSLGALADHQQSAVHAEAGLRAMEKVADDQSPDVRALLFLGAGIAAGSLGNAKLQRERFDQGIEFAEAHPSAYVGLVRLYEQSAHLCRSYEPERGIELAEKAIGIAEQALVRKYGADWESRDLAELPLSDDVILLATANVSSLTALAHLWRHQEGVRVGTRAVELMQRARPHHVVLAKAWRWLANGYRHMGNAKEALRCYRQSYDVWSALHPEGHPDRAMVGQGLANQLNLINRFEEAEELVREGLAFFREWNNPNATQKLRYGHFVLGNILARQGQDQASRASFEKSVEYGEKAGLSGGLGQSYDGLAAFLMSRKKYAEARPYFAKALDVHRRLHGPKGAQTVRSTFRLAECDYKGGSPGKCVEVMEPIMPIVRASNAEVWYLALFRSLLGGALARVGRHEEAVPLLELAVPALEKKFGADDFRTRDARSRLGEARSGK